jgi:hypothetical protein
MQRKRKPLDAGTLLGWLVFGLVIAGGPLLGALQSALGVRLPSYVLPLIIGGAVLLSAALSVVRALGAGRAQPQPGDMRYPDPATLPRPSLPNTPMPPFAGPTPLPPVLRPLDAGRNEPPAQQGAPGPGPIHAPRFEPVITAPLLLVGVLGVLALLGLGVLVLAGL